MNWLRNWFANGRDKRELNRRSLELSLDPALIKEHAPELAGMTDVQAMSHILQEIGDFKARYGQEAGVIFADRLREESEGWHRQGLSVPVWVSIAVLRRLQAEIDGNIAVAIADRNNLNGGRL